MKSVTGEFFLGVAKYKNGVYQKGSVVYNQFTNEIPEFSKYQNAGSIPGRMPFMQPGRELSGYEVWRYTTFDLSQGSQF